MDEATIAARLAQNIPKDEPSSTPSAIPQTEPVTEITHDPIQLDDAQLHQRMYDYFEVGRNARYVDKTQIQLRTILEWGAQNAQDHSDIMLNISRAERELGIRMKPNRLGLLYKFVKLQQASQNIQKEMELLSYGAE